MSDIVIRVEGLGKKYRIRHQRRERYTALRDVLARKALAPMRFLKSRLASARARRSTYGDDDEDFWALHDVSFEVARGNVVGVVGRNGAGKSTLLKIVSQITEPTAGRVTLRGRVASLLEVGTGFHPELTGRENIFLNGAILGMRRAEIRKQFDRIVEFAEVERFLDTAVKHYSSGMYVRLAFAVAAHLEPEILIVDEVLAVGDGAFQRKCLGKMNEVATQHGRTVIFVSHNLLALQTLCSHAVYLRSGMLAGFGKAQAQIAQYNESLLADLKRSSARMLRITPHLSLEHVEMPAAVTSAESMPFRVALCASAPVSVHDLCLLIHSSMGIRVAIIDLRRATGAYRIEADAPLTIEGLVRSMQLVEGQYVVGLYLDSSEFKGEVGELGTFTVHPRDNPHGVVPYAPQHRGYVELDFEFRSA